MRIDEQKRTNTIKLLGLINAKQMNIISYQGWLNVIGSIDYRLLNISVYNNDLALSLSLSLSLSL